jgi:hypothetical protein
MPKKRDHDEHEHEEEEHAPTVFATMPLNMVRFLISQMI